MSGYSYKILFDWLQTPDSPPVLGERFLRTLELMAMRAPEIEKNLEKIVLRS